MELRFFEIRDRGTFIPCFAFRVEPQDEAERYLAVRSGFVSGDGLVIFGRLEEPAAGYDPYNWGGSRTMKHAHLYIAEHWDTLKSGDVIDVQVILGETTEPKVSERITAPIYG